MLPIITKKPMTQDSQRNKLYSILIFFKIIFYSIKMPNCDSNEVHLHLQSHVKNNWGTYVLMPNGTILLNCCCSILK